MEGIEKLKIFFAQQAADADGPALLSRNGYKDYIVQLSTCDNWPERFVNHSYVLYLVRKKKQLPSLSWPSSELLGLILFQHHCPGHSKQAA